MNAAANVFVGMVESPLLIRPYLATTTSSELFSIMVAGFATIAGGALVGYIALGIPAAHLVAASVMSAPAALVARISPGSGGAIYRRSVETGQRIQSSWRKARATLNQQRHRGFIKRPLQKQPRPPAV